MRARMQRGTRREDFEQLRDGVDDVRVGVVHGGRTLRNALGGDDSSGVRASADAAFSQISGHALRGDVEHEALGPCP